MGERREIRSYRDLEVWERGIGLAEAVYRVTKSFPAEERFGMASQMQRAAVSVPSNIAEGWGRGPQADFLRFLAIVRGSLYELTTQVIIARRVGLVAEDEASVVMDQADTLSRKLLAYIRSLKARSS